MDGAAMLLAAGAYVAFVAFEGYLFAFNRRTAGIPDVLLIRAAGAGLALLVPAAALAGEPGRLVAAAVGALVAFSVLLVPHLIWPRAVGFGNVKESAYIGMHIGFAAGTAGAAAAFAAGAGVFGVALAALFLVARDRLAGRRSAFATTSAPWLLVGWAVTLLVTRSPVWN